MVSLHLFVPAVVLARSRGRAIVDVMTPTAILADLTADLFDLDVRVEGPDTVVLDLITDNGCGTLPACLYPTDPR